VKFLNPGVLEATKCFLDLPRGGESDLLFRRIRREKVSFSGMLKTFGKRIPLGTEAPSVNRSLKKFHRVVVNVFKNTEIVEALNKVDTHSVKMARDVYAG